MKQIIEKRWIRTSISIIAAIIFIVVSLGVADAAIYANKVHKGVEIGGVPVGGKTGKEAISDIDKLASVLESKPISIRYLDKTWTVRPKDINAQVNQDKTLERAFSLGRSGDAKRIIKERLNLWIKERNVKPVFDYNPDKLTKFINKIAKDVDKLPEDAGIKIIGDQVTITNSKNGQKIDQNILSSKILDALVLRSPRLVHLVVNVVEPNIHENDLPETKEIVEQMIGAPVTIKYHDKSWSITQQQLTDWVSFNKIQSRDSWGLDVNLDKGKVASYLTKITATIVSEPKDAKFDLKGDAVVILPSEAGLKVDIEKAVDGINNACKTREERYAMLETEIVKPKRTTEDAQQMGIKEKVSSYTTYFSARQAPRVHNIQTLARALDGTIVAPGEVFSFNGHVGPRSASKGYEEAMAIINGELIPTLGGGICQVATTLFNTIFFGGYEVVERHNHSLFISHYPTGRDATVSYGGPDLKFKNDSQAHILIKTWTTPSSITINFYSTNQGIKVDYSTSRPSNFTSYPTKYIKDPSLPKGVSKVRDKGIAGRDITAYRTVFKNGTVVKKDKFFSRYKPGTQVILVGTKQ